MTQVWPGLLESAVILGCGVLNRLRGTVGWRFGLPGRSLVWVAPLVSLLSLAVLPWPFALGWGLVYLFWGVWAWGFLFTFGKVIPQGRQISGLEAFLLRMSGGNYYVAFLLRHMFALPAVLLTPFGFILPFGIWLSYVLAWRVTAQWAIPVAEVLSGLIWGAAIVLSAHYPAYLVWAYSLK